MDVAFCLCKEKKKSLRHRLHSRGVHGPLMTLSQEHVTDDMHICQFHVMLSIADSGTNNSVPLFPSSLCAIFPSVH